MTAICGLRRRAGIPAELRQGGATKHTHPLPLEMTQAPCQASGTAKEDAGLPGVLQYHVCLVRESVSGTTGHFRRQQKSMPRSAAGNNIQ